MKKFIFILLILSLYSCFQTEDNTNNNCSSECTVLQGRFITMNNEGISGANLTFEYFKGASLSSYTRMISDLDSDDDGSFYDEFYLKDEEIDASSPGNLILRIDESSLNSIEGIITPDSANIFLEKWFDIDSRDTIIEQTFYFPKKTHVVLNLNNFVPIQENDRFEVRAMFPYGFENAEPDEYNDILETIYMPTNGQLYQATEINNSLNVIVV